MTEHEGMSVSDDIDRVLTGVNNLLLRESEEYSHVTTWLSCSMSINAISKLVSAAHTSGHQNYWTRTNVTASPSMRVVRVIFGGTDSTFKVGNKGLKACIENANDNRGTIICHPVRNI